MLHGEEKLGFVIVKFCIRLWNSAAYFGVLLTPPMLATKGS